MEHGEKPTSDYRLVTSNFVTRWHSAQQRFRFSFEMLTSHEGSSIGENRTLIENIITLLLGEVPFRPLDGPMPKTASDVFNFCKTVKRHGYAWSMSRKNRKCCCENIFQFKGVC
jgi:hypothetical protein